MKLKRGWGLIVQRPNSLTQLGQKSQEFFSLLFTVTSTIGCYSPSPPWAKLVWNCMVCNVNIVYGNLKSEYSQDYVQKPQRNCTFMNSASGWGLGAAKLYIVIVSPRSRFESRLGKPVFRGTCSDYRINGVPILYCNMQKNIKNSKTCSTWAGVFKWIRSTILHAIGNTVVKQLCQQLELICCCYMRPLVFYVWQQAQMLPKRHEGKN